ncbi:MAG: carbonic anhydrase [Thermoanaerobaculales bacterium]
MTELIYRVDPEGRHQPDPPNDALEARERLLDGNHRFVELFEKQQIVHVSPEAVGISPDGDAIPQRPFAAVLGCADARVPTELLFRCPSNALFVVRVAGNVGGAECVGSLEYAVATLAESLRVIVILGHSSCGAVIAAVDSYLDPQSYPSTSAPLRSIIDRILPAVRMADNALAAAHGGRTADSPRGRQALIETSVRVNAALTAASIHSALSFPVQFGVFDLVSREVDLSEPPVDTEAMLTLAAEVAASDRIRQALES